MSDDGQATVAEHEDGSVLPRVLEKVRRFTWPADSPEPVRVVLVSESTPLDSTRALLTTSQVSRPVRLVGQGATLWLQRNPAEGVSATEVGALQVDALGVETAELRHGLKSLVARLFDEDTEAPLARAFYPALCQRFAQRLLYSTPVRQRLRQVFRSAQVEEVGFPVMHRRPPLGYLATTELFAVGELARLGRDAARRRPTVQKLRSSSPVPSVWFALVPDWARINQHLLDLYGPDALADVTSLGILLVGTLNAGVRSEQTMRSEGLVPLSGLRGLETRAGVGPIHQAVMPADARTFAKAVARAVALGGRAAHRLNELTPDLIRLTGSCLSAGEAGRLLGVDLTRFELARAATQEFAASTDVSGKTFVFAASGSPALAAVDLELQRHGAQTIHLFHGGLGDDWLGAAEHCSLVHGAWTENDRRCLASLRDRVTVGGMPVRLRPKTRAVNPSSVLVMTSYLHRDYVGVRELEHFEREMVEFMVRLRSVRSTSHLEVRWRPHPGSLDWKLTPYIEQLSTRGVDVSRGRSLQDDVEAADLIVSNMSTVIAESVLTGLPVFVHIMPLHWGAPASDFVHESRGFFTAADGHALVERYLERCRLGSPDASPEDFMLERLFGPARRPGPLRLNLAR